MQSVVERILGVSVVLSAVYVRGAEPVSGDAAWAEWTLGVAVIVLLAALGWTIGRGMHGVRTWNAARRRARTDTDVIAFAALLRTLDGDDPLASYRALHAWRRSHDGGLAAWCIATNDAELLQEVTALERVVFGTGSNPRWRGDRLAKALQRLAAYAPHAVRRSALPPLNPPAHDLHE